MTREDAWVRRGIRRAKGVRLYGRGQAAQEIRHERRRPRGEALNELGLTREERVALDMFRRVW